MIEFLIKPLNRAEAFMFISETSLDEIKNYTVHSGLHVADFQISERLIFGLHANAH